MAKKRGKSVSFDAMVKFFIRNYDIPTRKDIKKLTDRIDNLEKLIKQSARFSTKNKSAYSSSSGGKMSGGKYAMTASDIVLGIVRSSKKGLGFADIQAKTGFNDKKLRNIIFRLNKIGKITRKSRGIYIAQ